MIDQKTVERLYECDVIDARGDRIGSVKQVWLDEASGQPIWASVHTGLFGMRESFVPIQDAQVKDKHITVPVEKQKVKDAPEVDASGGRLSDAEQADLYEYYGMIPAANRGEHDRLTQRSGNKVTGQERMAGQERMTEEQRMADRQRATGTRDQIGREQTRTTGQQARDTSRQSMTRSEEQLKVGTEQVEAGRVRLVKHVVTEQQNVTVPVSHEEVRVVREPVDPNDASARGGRAFQNEEAEVVLHEERPVVQKETIAVERVGLDKETVTEQRTVGGEIRKERVDVVDETRQTPGDRKR
ncbi:PRC and DUF2382 domain-containing protein [Umezawaea sp. Da 62-37]|uniref:PRC and DUF2382 domain-containing protein n=1 Tax=Umezawaea sp. Da 62-37 TaxID=3075927 RepID=UPI0028F7483A|nr:PRC and DUF2382 domain-containing protein [Umezawaea sp. Da 62-37]WNV88522.1 PRC and DUF2382 domain-containing protein [Umezawaea sp. Da 62-37]